METLDHLVRGAGVAAFLLVAAAEWRARPGRAFGWASLFYAMAITAFLLAPYAVAGNWPSAVKASLGLLATAAPFFFWLQTTLIYDDGFEPRPRHWAWLALLDACGVAAFLTRDHGPSWLHATFAGGFRLAGLTLVVLALRTIWFGREADLVETRALTRVWLVVSGGVAIALILLIGIVTGPAVLQPAQLRLGEAAGVLLLGLASGLVFLRLDQSFAPATDARAPAAPPLILHAAGSAPAALADPDAPVPARGADGARRSLARDRPHH